MSPKLRKWLRRLIPLFIVLFGAMSMIGLAMTRKRPQRQEVHTAGALVDVIKVSQQSRNVLIEGTGTVEPRYEISLIPQVSGKIEWVHPNFEAGGWFHKGDTLVQIEKKDYELAVRQAEATVAQAQYQEILARANAEIAKREWEIMQGQSEDNASSSPDPLVLHEPQLRQAEASLQSAEAALDKAKLNLERTVLTAPFNCMVRSESAAVGQLVSTATVVGTLYDTGIAEIEVTMPVSDLLWVPIPNAYARVDYKTGNKTYSWDGRVDRKIGVVDEVGRMARLVVQVKNPFFAKGGDRPSLDVGSFVSVEIEGREIENTVPLPRAVIHENNQVWVALPDSTLEFRDVSLYRLTPDEALIESGVNGGEMVVTTSITGAAPGMKLRIQDNGEEQ